MTVYLVGAGPGDPGLITVKGLACLKKADVVVYDYLANPRLLENVPAKARKVYVGKKGATHSKEQEDINALLIAEARKGRTVVRLKGGDPYVFGRGGEEAEALAEAGVPFEVVPGVTSAIAVPAYAGIPVTHRDFTSTVAFVTGHEQDEGGDFPPDWAALAKMGTLVFLMAYSNLPHIVAKLLEAGMDPRTPAIVIEWGTTPRQKTAASDLSGLLDAAKRVGIRPPTIVVIGRVVSLRDKIDWFSKRPLMGKRVLVTRAREQAGVLSRLLEEQGAKVIEVPTIVLRPPSSWKPLDTALRRLPTYDWLIVTSINGVAAFFDRLRKAGRDVRDLKDIRIAAVGPATARAVEERGVGVACVAKEFKAEGLLKALGKKVEGKKILFCRAKEGREVLVEGLKRLKARVDLVEAYRVGLPPQEVRRILRNTIKEGRIDMIVFASSTMVENFKKIVGDVPKIPVACIGPVTARTAKAQGLRVVVQPRKSAMPDLVREIGRYFAQQNSSKGQPFQF